MCPSFKLSMSPKLWPKNGTYLQNIKSKPFRYSENLPVLHAQGRGTSSSKCIKWLLQFVKFLTSKSITITKHRHQPNQK